MEDGSLMPIQCCVTLRCTWQCNTDDIGEEFNCFLLEVILFLILVGRASCIHGQQNPLSGSCCEF